VEYLTPTYNVVVLHSHSNFTNNTCTWLFSRGFYFWPPCIHFVVRTVTHSLALLRVWTRRYRAFASLTDATLYVAASTAIISPTQWLVCPVVLGWRLGYTLHNQSINKNSHSASVPEMTYYV